jgi:hypothetical protein
VKEIESKNTSSEALLKKSLVGSFQGSLIKGGYPDTAVKVLLRTQIYLELAAGRKKLIIIPVKRINPGACCNRLRLCLFSAHQKPITVNHQPLLS